MGVRTGSSQLHWYYYVKLKLNLMIQCKWRNFLTRYRVVNLSRPNLRHRTLLLHSAFRWITSIINQQLHLHKLHIKHLKALKIILYIPKKPIFINFAHIAVLTIHPLTPNDPYSGRTAPLTSKRCILYIYSTNTGTEYFKHGIHSRYFSLQNAVSFITLTYLVPVLFTFYIQSVLKLKKK